MREGIVKACTVNYGLAMIGKLKNKIDCSKSLDEANLKSLVEMPIPFPLLCANGVGTSTKYSQTYNPMIHLQFQVGADS